jgi:hypothetical protein
MRNSSLQDCAALLTQVFGESTTISFGNSVEAKFQNLSIGFWFDRGLYSVVISDEFNAYISSGIASFFHLDIQDAKEKPIMLMDNLLFIRDNFEKINNLLKEKNFAIRYKEENGYKPFQTEKRA